MGIKMVSKKHKVGKVPRGNEILETFQNSDISGLIGLFLALCHFVWLEGRLDAICV